MRYIRHIPETKIHNVMKNVADKTVICEKIDGITVIANLVSPLWMIAYILQLFLHLVFPWCSSECELEWTAICNILLFSSCFVCQGKLSLKRDSSIIFQKMMQMEKLRFYRVIIYIVLRIVWCRNSPDKVTKCKVTKLFWVEYFCLMIFLSNMLAHKSVKNRTKEVKNLYGWHIFFHGS